MSAPLPAPAPASTGRAPRRGLLLRGLMAAALSFTGLGAVTLAPAPASAAATCAQGFFPGEGDGLDPDRCYFVEFVPGTYDVTVPAGVTEMTVLLEGAAGGGLNHGPTLTGAGGLGGKVEGAVSVTAGQVLTATVGARGRAPYEMPGGSQGGGGAGTSQQASIGNTRGGASGGGGTFLARGGSLLAAAGGGGGAGMEGESSYVNAVYQGGAGSGSAGADGVDSQFAGTSGRGATPTGAGAAGSFNTAAAAPGTGPAEINSGQQLVPGSGGPGAAQSPFFGGGGGGGYFGGGGGVLAGGGGSGFVGGLKASPSPVQMSGTREGDGRVVISYLAPPAADVASVPRNVTVTPGNGSATVSWEAPESDGGASITEYSVFKSDSGPQDDTEDLTNPICRVIGNSTELTCNATGLTNGTTYWFTVVASNATGSSPFSAPVSTTPVAPPVKVATGIQLFQAFDSGGAGCGTTVRLTQPITQALSVSHQCGAAPITLDLNGHDLTLDLLTSSFTSAAGDVLVTNSDQTKGATLTSTLAAYQGDVRVGRGVTVVAASRTTSAGEIFPGAFIGSTGDFIVDGGTVQASSSNPLVPAIGGRVTQGVNTIHGSGRVVLESGAITASRTGTTGTSPVIGGATVGSPATSGQNTTVPVVVRGGTLTLDAGAATAPAYGVGGGYTPPLSSTTGRLVLAGTSDSSAKVVLSQGTIRSILLDGADGALPTHNELDNSGALLPDQNGVVQIPEAIKVTGDHYRVSFPGDTALTVAAESLSAGGVAIPSGGPWVVGSTPLTADTALDEMTGTRNADSGALELTATQAPLVVATFAALKDSLDSRKPGNACGRPVQLADDFPATAPDALLEVFCEGTPVTLDLNGQELALPNGLVVYGTGGVSLTSSVDGGTISGRALIEADTTLRVLEGVTLRVTTAVSGAGSNVDVMPGVGFGSVLAQLEVAGGTVVASSADSRGPAIGSIGRLAVDRRLNFRPGSVLVSSGSLTATGAGGGVDGAPAIGGATNGTTGGPATPVTVTGGTLMLDSGDPATAALGAGKGVDPAYPLPSVLLKLGGTEATPADVELVQGTIFANRVRTVQGTLRAHNLLDNDGALVPDQVDGTIVFPDNLKVTGHHYGITFPAAPGSEQGVSRIVMAKTFALGRATIPSGSFVVNGLDLTADTDLSTLGGTPNAQSGQVLLRAKVAPRTASSVEQLNSLLDPAVTPNGCADGVRLGEGSFVAPTSVVTSKCVGFVDVDLAGKSLTVRDFKTTAGNTVNVRSTTAGGALTVGSVDLSAGGTFTLRQGATLTANGRLSLDTPELGPTMTYLYPGVQFGATRGAFRVEGGTATVKSADASGPAVGPLVLVDQFADDANGTVRVLSGSLSVSKPSGGVPLIGGDGFQQTDIALEVFGGSVSLDAGSATSAVMDLTRSQTRTSAAIAVRQSESGAPGSVTVTRGRVVLADVNQTAPGEDLSVGPGGTFTLGANASLTGTAGTAAGQGEIVNNGTITAPVANVTVSKVSGNNYALTFPSGTQPGTLRVLAKTLQAGGVAELPQPRRWRVGDTKLELSTDLSELGGGSPNATTGLTTYEVTKGDPEVASFAELKAALDECTSGDVTITLTAAITELSQVPTVKCNVTLDLAGYTLTLRQLALAQDLGLTVVDSGRTVNGGPVKGGLVLDTPDSGSPFLFPTVAGDVPSVTLNAAVQIAGAQVLPAGSKLTVGENGVLSKVGGEGKTASITGPDTATLDNQGRIGAAITVTGVKVEGPDTTVTFHLPGGTTQVVRVLGTTLDSAGVDFPEIAGVAGDEYVRWGTAANGGVKVLESTTLAAGAVALYPTIVKKGTELVSSIGELEAALAGVGQTGGPARITLAADLLSTSNQLAVSATTSPVTLDLNGFDLEVPALRLQGSSLVVADTRPVEPNARPGTLRITADGDYPAVTLTQAASFAVASGRVEVQASAGYPGIRTLSASDGSVTVSGGVLQVVADLARPNETAIGSTSVQAPRGSVSVTGGELRVRGFSTDHASLSVGASGRVVALTAAEAGLVGDEVGAAIGGAGKVVNNGAIVGDLAGVKAPVGPNNAVVTLATAGGELPVGAPSKLSAYAGSLAAAGVESLPTPTRGAPGQWVFAGWKVVSDGPATDFDTTTGLPDSNDAGTTPGAVTVTGQWTPQSISVSSLTELQEALAAGWPIVTVAAGTVLDLGDATLDLGSARLVVPATSEVSGGARARIVGAAGAVIQNAGAIGVAVPVGTGAAAYAGSFRGDAFAVSYSGLSGDASTAQVLGASVSAVGKSLPIGPVVSGKRFVGWSLVEQTGPQGANPSPEVLAATGRLGTATAVDGALSAVTLFPVYEDRPAITEVGSVEALLESLSCENGIAAPAKVKLTADLDLAGLDPVSTACSVELDLSGGSLVIGEALSLGGDLKVAGGELSLGDDLALGVYTLTIGATGKVTGQITSDVTRVVDGDRAGKIVNNGVFTWPKGLGAGDDAVPVQGLHYGFSFTVPGDVVAPEDRTVFAPTVAAAGGTGGTGLGSLPGPARPGFTFLGWNTKADGTGVTVSSLTDLAEVFETSSDGSPVAVQLFALYAAIPVAPTTSPSPTATATPSPTATATPTPTATATATATPTPTGGPVVPVEEEPVLEVDPIGGGSTGGAPQVGVPVTVSVTVPDVPGAAVAFQWQVVLEDGTVVDIPGATGDAYTPTGEFAGGLLQVRVTTTAPGFSPDVRVVAFPRTAPVKPGVFEQTRVDRKVRGGVQDRPIVGKTVRGVLPKGYVAALPQGTQVSYQWAKGRKPIAGARGESRVLEVTRGMVGRKLRLTVTVSALGYDTYTVAAPKTRIVKPAGWQGKKKPGRSSGGTQ